MENECNASQYIHMSMLFIQFIASLTIVNKHFSVLNVASTFIGKSLHSGKSTPFGQIISYSIFIIVLYTFVVNLVHRNIWDFLWDFFLIDFGKSISLNTIQNKEAKISGSVLI